jgi:lipopolysaccharide assembly outer membrane protein LptD (OstA)
MFCIFFIINNLKGQIDTTFISHDSVSSVSDTIELATMPADSAVINSLQPKKRLSPDAIQSSIKYISQDSIIINMRNKKIFLFENAKAEYEDITLDAAFMEYSFVNSELYASGMADSCGKIHGPPVFKQGDGEYCSQEIRYNFRSKKGKVTKVITTEGDGYIHGHSVKHIDDKVSYIKGGQYTTCNLEHPHFQIRFGKAKVIQDEKIITGPAYISFGKVPTPIAIPFGYFPIKGERASGIVFPFIGESTVRGFYFENFGYYFGINDNFDLLFMGDISTRGSWAAKAKTNYVFKYKCNGVIDLSFAQNFLGERKTPSWERKDDFRVHWTHNQDPKAHPTTRFSAHVNFVTMNYNKYNPTSTAEYLSNEFASTINLSTNAKGIFFFDAAVSYKQNTYRKDVNISLPEINMSVRQFYPFRKRAKAGKLKWYDNISMKWTSQMSNRINTVDSLLLKSKTWEEIQMAIQHTVPLNIPIKVGKAFNWNTNATLVEKWYMQRDLKAFTTETDTVHYEIPKIKDIFQRGFFALHDVSLSTSLTTKIFFTYTTKKGVLALRHVMSPDLSFTYRPNLNGNTYGTYFNTITGKEVQYSYFSGGGTSRTQAIARFTVNNNLEIKVKSKKDTITGVRKISIFDNLSISCGYDFAADSLNWDYFKISGRTSLFSFLDVTFQFSFDPYIINNKGIRVNQTEAKVNKRGMRFLGSGLNLGVNWRLDQEFFKGLKKESKSNGEVSKQKEPIFPETVLGTPNTRPDFKNPWSVTINYTFNYGDNENFTYYIHRNNKKYNSNIVQTINISADINITRKWKLEVLTGYDIQQKDFSYTEFRIYRDLHCWEMRLNWIPWGHRKG